MKQELEKLLDELWADRMRWENSKDDTRCMTHGRYEGAQMMCWRAGYTIIIKTSNMVRKHILKKTRG